MPRKKTHEEYVAEVAAINPNIEVVGKYVNSQTNILHRCKIDGYEWDVMPNNILRGRCCPRCSSRERYTQKEYVVKVNKINSNIEVVGTYINNHTNILHRCKIDGYEWMAQPANILYGYGCSVCSGHKKTHEQYVAEVAAINPDIEVVEEYIGSRTEILHRCKIDGHEWRVRPDAILSGGKCPICNVVNMTKTHDEYVIEVISVNPNIEVIGRYINSKTKILHRCKIDGYEWLVEPSSILSGHGCPKCNASHGERNVEMYLTNHNINYIPQYRFDNCRNKLPLPFDFYLPYYNTCIEYDGEQHFKPIDFSGKDEENALKKLLQTQHNDTIKNKYCEENNVTLLRIRYDEDVEEILNNFFAGIEINNLT